MHKCFSDTSSLWPCRGRGYREYAGRTSQDYSWRCLDFEDFGNHAWHDNMVLLQSWLYFGVLSNVFGDEFTYDTFVRQEGQSLVLDSTAPTHLIERKRQTHASRLTSLGRYRSVQERKKQGIFSILVRADAQVEDIELHLHDKRNLASLPEILLSIRVLTQTLSSLCSEYFYREAFRKQCSDGVLRPSLWPLHRYIIPSRGWCPQRRLYFCEALNPTTLYYFASLRRNCGIDHSQCENEKACVANTISSNFRGYHVENDCCCKPIVPVNQADMFGILKDGSIPVVTVSRRKDHGIQLRYSRADMSTAYVAISNVWSEGLGDPDHNYLPRCQLNKLVSGIYRARSSGAGWKLSSTRALNAGTWRPNSTSGADHDGNLLAKPITFWLDAYCIPSASVDGQVMAVK